MSSKQYAGLERACVPERGADALDDAGTFSDPDLDLDLDLAAGNEVAATILCVDDEKAILSALRRALREDGHMLLSCESGEAGLALLEKHPVDLVLSDMRMPGMGGAAFLAAVRSRHPEVVRVLLTGYSDVQSVIEAINRGEIYRYVEKPWEDHALRLVVREGLVRKRLEQEKRALVRLTQRQNEALLQFNAELESRVAARTRDLNQTRDDLVASNNRLKGNFLTSIKVFAGLIALRAPALSEHSRRAAELARRIARDMQVGPQEVQNIFVAGLLHNVGMLSLPDELLKMPVSMMRGDALALYRKYPLIGEQLLMPLEDLRGSARLVRMQQERFDGKGFPDGLSGFEIALGARILAVARDYEGLLCGVLTQRRLKPPEALAAITRGRSERYDPAVADALLHMFEGSGRSASTVAPDDPATVAALRPGMVISRDLIGPEGFLLLSADHVLTERLIRQLSEFERSAGLALTVYIRRERSP